MIDLASLPTAVSSILMGPLIIGLLFWVISILTRPIGATLSVTQKSTVSPCGVLS